MRCLDDSDPEVRRSIHGRAFAMTVLSPVRSRRVWLTQLLLFAGEHLDVLFRRRIRQLSFIHCARWSLVGPRILSPSAAERPRRPRQRYLLFESNFNGGGGEYLDTFGLAMRVPVNLTWGTSYGFPGALPTGPFKDCVRRNDFRADFYYSAYPEASASTVVAALALSADIADLARQVDRIDAGRFQEEFTHLLTRWQGGLGEPPAWVQAGRIGPWVRDPLRQSCAITVLAPIRPERLQDLQRTLARLSATREGVFGRVGATHFARWVVIDQLVYEGFGQRPDHLHEPLLLFAANVDGPLDAYLQSLRSRIPGVVDEVWGSCHDYPGSHDAQRFARFLRARLLSPALRYAASPGATVDDVRSSLALRRRFLEVAADAQGMAAQALVNRFRREFPLAELPVGLSTRPGGDPARWPRAAVAGQAAPVAARARPRRRGLAARRPRWWDEPAGLGPTPEPRNLQGLVRGYGRRSFRCAAYVFATITCATAARRWLHQVWADDVSTSHDWEGSAPATTLDVAFTHRGLTRLGVPERSLASFPRPFRDGMASRACLLGDTGAAAPEHWDPPFRRDPEGAVGPGDEVHVLVALHARDGGRLRRQREEVERRMRRSGFRVLGHHEGARLEGDREHFGFPDGISQPEIRGIPTGRAGRGRGRRPPTTTSPPIATGELLLGHPNEDRLLPDAPTPGLLARDGTYLVYRRIEQDVGAFQRFLRDRAATLGCHEEELAAKILGRSVKGVPLDRDPNPCDGRRPSDQERNDFDYSGDPTGQRCPLGAHIRRANPRAGLAAGPDLVRRHRILRRGMPYGDRWTRERDDDRGRRGLIFIALMADIENQFEFVQRQWLNDGDAFKLGNDADLIAGAGTGGGRMIIQGDPPRLVTAAPRLTTVRGGDYFFLPGVDALRWLAEGWADETPSRRAGGTSPAAGSEPRGTPGNAGNGSVPVAQGAGRRRPPAWPWPRRWWPTADADGAGVTPVGESSSP
jgi:Dyp-type peroxidase family